MEKKIKVKHTHRYTKESAILFEGTSQIDDYPGYRKIAFLEGLNVKVVFYCFETFVEVHRFAEVVSQLSLKPKQRTSNPIKSEYGVFDVEIYTYEYEVNTNYVKVSYDIENGSDDKDGFIVEIEIEEGVYEHN